MNTDIVARYNSIKRMIKGYEAQRVFNNKYYSLKRQADKIEKQFPIFVR